MRLLNHGLMYIIILKMPKCRTFKFILDSEHSGYVLISNSKFDLRFVTGVRVNKGECSPVNNKSNKTPH